METALQNDVLRVLADVSNYYKSVTTYAWYQPPGKIRRYHHLPITRLHIKAKSTKPLQKGVLDMWVGEVPLKVAEMLSFWLLLMLV